MIKLVYMQDTINYMLELDKRLLHELDKLDKPELKVIYNEGSEPLQYYLFEIEKE